MEFAWCSIRSYLYIYPFESTAFVPGRFAKRIFVFKYSDVY